jgi:hypothetical protein
MPTVRTKFNPDQDLVVTDRDAYDLRQQGLLVDDDAAPEQDPSAASDLPDADQAREDRNAAQRESLGEDKAQPKSQAKTKTEGK